MSFRTVAGITGTVLLASVLFYFRWWAAALLLLPAGSLLVWYFTKEQRLSRMLLTALAAWLALTAGAIWFWLTPSQPIYLQANGVAFDGGRVFVSDVAAHRILVFDTNLNLLGEWPGNVGGPAGLAFAGDGRLLILESLQHRYSLTADGQHYEFGPGEYGVAFGRYRYPQDVAADRSNRLYIADTGNHRIVIVNATTRAIETMLDIPGGAPRGLAISPLDQSLLVADSFNDRVLLYDSVYRALKITLPISGTTLLNPGDVTADAQGTIFVTDTGNKRIAIFSPQGEFKGEIRPSFPWSPEQLAVGPGNDLLVVDALSGKLLLLNSNGEVVRAVGDQPPLPGSAQTQRSWAGALAVLGVALALAALLAAWAIGGLNIAAWWELKPWPAVWLMWRTVGALIWPARFNVARQKVLDGNTETPVRQLGPGLVAIQGASAVAFERGGALTRVVLPGTVLTEPGEVIRNVFDLRLQTRHVDQTREAVYSRDAIPLEVKFTLQYRIIQDETALVTKGRYEVKPEDLRRAALNAKDWHEQTEHAAREVLREVITTRRIEEIFDPRRTQIGFISPRAPLQHEMRRRLMQLTPRWGVEVVSVTLDEIRLPEKVRERLLQVWDVEWHRMVEIGRAQTELWKLQEQAEFKRDDERRQLETQVKQLQLQMEALWAESLTLTEQQRLRLDRQKEEAHGQAELAQLQHDMRRTTAQVDSEIHQVRAEMEAHIRTLLGHSEAEVSAEHLRKLIEAIREAAPALKDKNTFNLIFKFMAFINPSELSALRKVIEQLQHENRVDAGRSRLTGNDDEARLRNLPPARTLGGEDTLPE